MDNTPDPYRKMKKPKTVLFIIMSDESRNTDTPLFVEIEDENADHFYLVSNPKKATVFSYGMAELFRMREGRNKYTQVPRYQHVQTYEQQVIEKELPSVPFWLKPKKEEVKPPSIFAKIMVESVPKIIPKPNIFTEKKEKVNFWEK